MDERRMDMVQKEPQLWREAFDAQRAMMEELIIGAEQAVSRARLAVAYRQRVMTSIMLRRNHAGGTRPISGSLG